MGRKRKYFTEEEKKDAQKKWQMEHYQRNKEDICKKARERYQKKKKEIMDCNCQVCKCGTSCECTCCNC